MNELRMIVAVVLIVGALGLAAAAQAAASGRVTIRLTEINPHGGGTLRVMAVREDGTPAVGRTVITLTSPCFQSVVIDDTFVDFGMSYDGGAADGRLFDFIVPDSQCHGTYAVSVIVFDEARALVGGMQFKY